VSLKEKVENNLAIWLLSTLFAGFMAGIGTYKAVLEMAQLEVVSKARLDALAVQAPAASKPAQVQPRVYQSQRITFTLGPGQISTPFKFSLSSPRKVEFQLVSVDPPHDLLVEVCGPAEPECKPDQRAVGVPFYRDLGEGDIAVSAFNFTGNPSVKAVLEVRYPQ